jgi:uncharacterized membrane protein
MYLIFGCPAGRHLAGESASHSGGSSLVLQLRRSHPELSQEARTVFTILIGLFMAASILPVLQGYWLVPVYALGTMAVLVGALEWHARSARDAEWLAIADGRVRWRDKEGQTIDLPTRTVRLVQESAGPDRLRLFLDSQWQRVEIGTCLDIAEKHAVARLIEDHLRDARA